MGWPARRAASLCSTTQLCQLQLYRKLPLGATRTAPESQTHAGRNVVLLTAWVFKKDYFQQHLNSLFYGHFLWTSASNTLTSLCCWMWFSISSKCEDMLMIQQHERDLFSMFGQFSHSLKHLWPWRAWAAKLLHVKASKLHQLLARVPQMFRKI